MNPSLELPEVTVAAARWAALRQQVAQVQTWLAAEAARAADEALAYRLRVLAALTPAGKACVGSERCPSGRWESCSQVPIPP